MADDAGPKTHAVRLAMHDRDEMKGVYNPFAYQKGAAVLLMLENWLGEDRLRNALRDYLQRHRFGTATTADLAQALRAIGGTNVAPVMHSFLDQAGIPTIRAELHCERGKASHVTIEQVSAVTQWTIPVCWKTEGTSGSCIVLNKPRLDIELPAGDACPAFLELNSGGNGYYRSEYTSEQASALASHAPELSAAERLTLVYDLRWMEKAGRIEPAAVRPLLKKLASDTESEVARAAGEALAAAH
jgi:aminopeptidase N